MAVKAIETHGEAGRRVMREAQAAARLNHDGIVTLFELGQENGHAYLVSELVEGSTLRQLATQGALSDRDVAELGADLCEALAHAHDQGVYHRDIKPDNVIAHEPDFPLPSGASRAKLMDFGTARLADAVSLTATGEVIGTIAYMAPEQAEGGETGPGCDVYSLALTLYECWSGRNPVLRATPAATARALGDPVTPLEAHRRGLPLPLCAAIDACLDPDPERRPTLGQLRSVLLRAIPELDARAPVPTPRSRRAAAARLTPVLVAGAALLPPLAPALAAIGLAPLYAAIAGAAGSSARRAGALALLGVASLAIAGAIPLGTGLFAAAGLWVAASIAFGILVRGRAVALVMLGVLVWSAGVVALHGTLLPGAKPPSGAAVGALALTLAAAVAWRRSGGSWSLPIPLQGRRAAGPLA